MRLTHLVLLALASFGLCQLVTLDTVIADIISLDDAVRALIASTQAYTGGLLLSQGINFAVVEGRLTKANADITQLPSAKLSVPEIRRLEDTVAQTLAIDNPRAVDVLISKKSLIQQTPLQGGIVRAGLQSLLKGHLYFSDQALKRTPESEVRNVQALVDVISNALQRGIDSFATA